MRWPTAGDAPARVDEGAVDGFPLDLRPRRWPRMVATVMVALVAAAAVVAGAVALLVRDNRNHRHPAPPISVVRFATTINGRPVTELTHVAARSGQLLTLSAELTIPSGTRITELHIAAAGPHWSTGGNGLFGDVQPILDRAQSATGSLSVHAQWTASPVAGARTLTLEAAYDAIDKNVSYGTTQTLVALDIT
jgi:hypothetical protein